MKRAAALALLAPALAACGGTTHHRGIVGHSTVTVGLLVDVRGDGEIAQGAKQAVREINGRGGIGKAVELRLEVRDSQRKPARAARLARRLLADGARVLVLPCDVASERAVVDAARGTQVLLLATCNYDPQLVAHTANLWAVGAGANVEMAALADYLKDEGLKTAYVTPANDVGSYAPDIELLDHYFQAAARSRGISLVAEPSAKTAIVVVRWPGFTTLFTRTYTSFTVVGTSLGQGPETRRARNLVLTGYGYPSRATLGAAAIELYEKAVSRAGTAPAAVERELGDIQPKNPKADVLILHADGGNVEVLRRASPDEVPPP